MDEHEHLNELIPAYALGSLSREELLAVARHLESCASCRDELEAYEETVDELGLLVPSMEPPPGMKERLFQQIKAGQPAPSSPVRLPPARSRLPLWAAAALILLLVLGNFLLWQSLDRVEDVAPAHFETLILNPTENMPRARGVLLIGGNDHFGTLVVQYLPALPAEQVYQLWLAADDQWLDGGTFALLDGYHSHWLETPRPLDSYSLYQITVEPAGGSPIPTGPAVLRLEQ